MTTTRKAPTKTYVLDTNVLLHDPESIYNFEEHRVVLPVEVLSELDHKKTAPGALGANARAVNRYLREAFSDGLEGKTAVLVAKYEEEGELQVVIQANLRKHLCSTRSEDREGLDALNAIATKLDDTLVSLKEPDHRILAAALYVQAHYASKKHEVILVTKDSNMALKGMALGLKVEDYLTDAVDGTDTETRRIILEDPQDMEMFISQVDQKLFISSVDTADLLINEYVFLECDGMTTPARHVGEGVFTTLPLYQEFCSKGVRQGLQLPKGNRVLPRNLEQWLLMDALLNPEISLVTVRGKAGTGKTFIAIAAALHEVLSERTSYTRCYISRPVVTMGKDPGALPGTLEDKMAPYVQPYYDNLEALFGKKKSFLGQGGTRTDNPDVLATKTAQKKSKKPAKVFTEKGQSGHQKPSKPYQWLLDSGIIEIEALTFIRGRSIANAFMIMDEAQNLTPHEAKTLVTRMGEGSKLILLGDPAQIDSPFLDANSNGLVLVRERMANLGLAAHVSLVEGVRSPLSDAAADLL
jgi:PhoH-like ATPase